MALNGNEGPVKILDTSGVAPEVVGEGRKCEDCGTRLNRYNKTNKCGVCRNKQKGGLPPLTGGPAVI